MSSELHLSVKRLGLADVADAHAIAFYQALGGEAAPVTMFSFDIIQ